jgi:ligand-binding sensor domain-containing protein
MKKTLTIFFILLFTNLFSQSENWKIYNSLNSPLPNNKIVQTIIDNNNVMYFASHEGLIVFDGLTWKKFNKENSKLPSNKILCLEVDIFNNKWIGTPNGLLIFKKDNFKYFTTENSKLPSNKIRKIKIFKEKKYIATDKGLVVISLSDTIIYNKTKIFDNNIIDIEIDEKENVWIATNSGLVKLNNNKVNIYTKENSILLDNHVWSLKIENENIWVGTKKGLLKITEETWEVFTKKNSILPSNTITQITTDEYNRVWFASTKGIISFDGTDWKKYKIHKKLKTVFSVFIDKKDNKWISTEKALIVYNEEGVSEIIKKKTKETDYFKIKNNSEIEYFIPQSTKVEIIIYNNLGEEVRVLFSEKMLKGTHHCYNITNKLTTGSYLCKFKTEKTSDTKKIIVMK